MTTSTTTQLTVQVLHGLEGPSRDRELIQFVGRHGIVSIEHVMAALGVGRTAAYRRVATLIDAGLIERQDILRCEPSLLSATTAGLDYIGLPFEQIRVAPGAIDHMLRCTSTSLALAQRYGHDRVATEREIALLERHSDRPIASAKFGEYPSGAPRLHRPDLVILPDGPQMANPTDPAHGWTRDVGSDASYADLESEPQGPSSPRTQGGWQGERTEPCVTRRHPTEDTGMRSVPEALIAVEVELTPKSPRRLQQIIRAWRRATWVDQVHYYCAPGPTTRAVRRAVEKMRASDRIQIFEVMPR